MSDEKKEGEWGFGSIKTVELTDNEREKLLNKVTSMAKKRQDADALENSADFCAGALTVIEALNIPCPNWPFMLGCGRPWFEGERTGRCDTCKHAEEDNEDLCEQCHYNADSLNKDMPNYSFNG